MDLFSKSIALKKAFEAKTTKSIPGKPIALGFSTKDFSSVGIPDDKINCPTLISGTSAERDAILTTMLDQQIGRGGAVLFCLMRINPTFWMM